MVLRGNCTCYHLEQYEGELLGLMTEREREHYFTPVEGLYFQPWAIIVGLRASPVNVY